MRIDKYLKVSRLIKRRSVANEACDQGRITVNGKIVKASYDVKENDIIEIKMGERANAAGHRKDSGAERAFRRHDGLSSQGRH